MIAMLSGKVVQKNEGKVVVDINGVGYEVNIPHSLVLSCGDIVNLHIKTIVREDDISFFGFKNKEKKDIFILLKSVSGIGAKTALAVISYYSINDLSQIIVTKNAKLLSKVPGIGLKTAERMIVDLKEKFGRLGTASSTNIENNESYDDLLNALINLGFKQNQAQKALESKLNDINSGRALEDVLREILQGIA